MTSNRANPVTPHGAFQASSIASRSSLPLAFATAGATLGLALGLIEAGFLYHIPRFRGLTKPDVCNAIWLITPAADAPLFALGGLLLGMIAALLRRTRPIWQAGWAAVGIGLCAAYLGWIFLWFRVGVGIIFPGPLFPRSPIVDLLLTPALYFVIGCAASAAAFRFAWRRVEPFFAGSRSWNWRWLAGLDAAATAVLALALVYILARGTPLPSSKSAPSSPRGMRKNIVFIMLDTVRADHLSCYAYPRPTTPNLDRLASEGVLFEHALAPTSWTLPSLASVFTGLLPHQHGASWGKAMSSQPVTLAQILKAQGYETASFNANASFGLAGWGLDQGFEVYRDAHDWLRHNLASTFAGQSVYQALFQEFVSFNEFDHLDAEQMNRQVFDWLHHRSTRPFFLFVNYMDAHRPYVPPAPYDHRFGQIPRRVLWNIVYSLQDGHWSRPVSSLDRRDLIDGYDNSLNYLDEQVAQLRRVLEGLHEAGPTILIVAGDHGESFGEHNTYDHGWNLYREVLHVPLLIAGSGIPAGRRVGDAVALSDLFPTVIQLALGDVDPSVRQASMSHFWMSGDVTGADLLPVVSELSPSSYDSSETSSLSLSDGRWHYVLGRDGHAELFDWNKDSAEKNNLAESVDQQSVVNLLRSRLESIMARSLMPWRDLSFLAPLDRPGLPFAHRVAASPDAFPLLGVPVGSTQDLFANQLPQQALPPPFERDVLHSLPYH